MTRATQTPNIILKHFPEVYSHSKDFWYSIISGNESLAELKAKIYEVEGSEDVFLYVCGKPFNYEMPVSSIAEFHVDVTVMMSYLPIYYVSCNFATYIPFFFELWSSWPRLEANHS